MLKKIQNGVEVLKPKYLVLNDIDLEVKDEEKQKAFFKELTKLLNL